MKLEVVKAADSEKSKKMELEACEKPSEWWSSNEIPTRINSRERISRAASSQHVQL